MIHFFLSRVHGLKADNGSEADAWYSALRHTQVCIVYVCLSIKPSMTSCGITSPALVEFTGQKAPKLVSSLGNCTAVVLLLW